MSSKAIRLLALIAAFMLVLAACSPSSSEGGDSDDGGDTATTQAEDTDAGGDDDAMDDEDDGAMDDDMELDANCHVAPPAEATEVDFMGWEFPITSIYADELKGCEAIGNLTVNIQLLDSAGAQDQVTLDLSTGDPSFEIIHADNGFLGRLAGEGQLLALNDLIEKYSEQFDLEGIESGFWDMGTIDGQVYGVPLIGNTMHFFYNPNILTDAGVDVPQTYDDVIAVCPTLQDAGYSVPFTMNVHADWAWRIEFTNFIKSYGGAILDENSMPLWNGPEGVAAATKMLEVIDACMGAEGTAFSIDDSQAALQTAELPMASIWASRAAAMDDPEASLVVGEIMFAPALYGDPDGLRNGAAYGDFYAIPTGTSVDPDFLFQLIAATGDVQSQSEAATAGIVSRGIEVDGGPRDIEAAAITINEGIGPDNQNPAMSIANAALGTWLVQLTEGVSVEEALANAEADYLSEAAAQGFIDG